MGITKLKKMNVKNNNKIKMESVNQAKLISNEDRLDEEIKNIVKQQEKNNETHDLCIILANPIKTELFLNSLRLVSYTKSSLGIFCTNERLTICDLTKREYIQIDIPMYFFNSYRIKDNKQNFLISSSDLISVLTTFKKDKMRTLVISLDNKMNLLLIDFIDTKGKLKKYELPLISNKDLMETQLKENDFETFEKIRNQCKNKISLNTIDFFDLVNEVTFIQDNEILFKAIDDNLILTNTHKQKKSEVLVTQIIAKFELENKTKEVSNLFNFHQIQGIANSLKFIADSITIFLDNKLPLANQTNEYIKLYYLSAPMIKK